MLVGSRGNPVSRSSVPSGAGRGRLRSEPRFSWFLIPAMFSSFRRGKQGSRKSCAGPGLHSRRTEPGSLANGLPEGSMCRGGSTGSAIRKAPPLVAERPAAATCPLQASIFRRKAGSVPACQVAVVTRLRARESTWAPSLGQGPSLLRPGRTERLPSDWTMSSCFLGELHPGITSEHCPG